jgi:hypothetical protein
MAARLPDGSTVFLATTYASAKTITAITNANPGVASSTAHGYSNADLLEITSGWSKLTNRIVRVSGSVADAFNLEGIDTSDTTAYPAAGGAGSSRKITAFTQINQIMGFTTSGGDQQFANFSFMEDDFERQLPTITSAQSLQFEIADDPSLAGYIALKAAGEARATRALKLVLPDNSLILYNGIVSFNETPTLNKGQVMVVKATLSLNSRPVRYAS